MTWEAVCDISELPPHLRRLAEYRKDTRAFKPAGCVLSNSVRSFDWSKTPEGHNFWFKVYRGIVPDNLEEVLAAFERAHPELCKENEAVSETEVAAINWEQRRYEISKSIMAAFLSKEDDRFENLAKLSVEGADALITELKKHK